MKVSKEEINFINKKINMLKKDTHDLSKVFLISRLIDEIIQRQNIKKLFH